jgi:cyclohexanone monooxygenase
LPAFNRPNVHLIDTEGKGIDEITETGIVANGEAFELDCIIFATGFEVGTDYTRRSGYDLIGRNGLSLKEKWSEGIATLTRDSDPGISQLLYHSHRPSGLHRELPPRYERTSQAHRLHSRRMQEGQGQCRWR